MNKNLLIKIEAFALMLALAPAILSILGLLIWVPWFITWKDRAEDYDEPTQGMY